MSVGAGGLDLTKNHLKMKKKTKKKMKKREKKIVFGAGFEPTTLRLQILHLTPRLKLQSAITPVKFNGFFSKINQVI